MRASSPALALVPRPTTVPRPRIVPRPRPRVAPPSKPRLTLASVDLEEIDDHEQAPRSTLDDLPSFETMVEAVSCCVVTAMQAIPSLAGLAVLRGAETGG